MLGAPLDAVDVEVPYGGSLQRSMIHGNNEYSNESLDLKYSNDCGGETSSRILGIDQDASSLEIGDFDLFAHDSWSDELRETSSSGSCSQGFRLQGKL
jgi:hypothetical protein